MHHVGYILELPSTGKLLPGHPQRLVLAPGGVLFRNEREAGNAARAMGCGHWGVLAVSAGPVDDEEQACRTEAPDQTPRGPAAQPRAEANRCNLPGYDERQIADQATVENRPFGMSPDQAAAAWRMACLAAPSLFATEDDEDAFKAAMRDLAGFVDSHLGLRVRKSRYDDKGDWLAAICNHAIRRFGGGACGSS